jgi:G3E family GTPase
VLRGYTGLPALLDARQSDVQRGFVAVRTHRAIQTLVLAVDGDLDEDRFGDWIETDLGAFEGRLLRVKGIVAIAGVDERIVLQGVANRIEAAQGKVWGDEPRYSRLVVIGFALDDVELSRGFVKCVPD